MAIPFAAGGAAMKMLRMLYKAKKKIGKTSALAADKAGKAGFTNTSKVISGTSQKVHSGTMKAKKLAKKYQKISFCLLRMSLLAMELSKQLEMFFVILKKEI